MRHLANECVIVSFSRYVVCVDLQPGCEAIHNYMYEVNLELHRLRQEMANMDVLEVSAVVLEVKLQFRRDRFIKHTCRWSEMIYKKSHVRRMLLRLEFNLYCNLPILQVP